jgi:hypothetical protein
MAANCMAQVSWTRKLDIERLLNFLHRENFRQLPNVNLLGMHLGQIARKLKNWANQAFEQRSLIACPNPPLERGKSRT